MNWSRFEVRARSTIVKGGVEIYLIRHNEDGSMDYAGEIPINHMDRNTVEKATVAIDDNIPKMLHLPEALAQRLIDELWICGFRPTEGTGSAGSLKATQNHLGDMQKLSWRLLSMTEKVLDRIAEKPDDID
jgi:hypothetical protein